MPLSKDKWLQIVRDGSVSAKDKRRWKIEHIEAALCIIFGGAQYKAGSRDKFMGNAKERHFESTKFWLAPNFGLHLSGLGKFGLVLKMGPRARAHTHQEEERDKVGGTQTDTDTGRD
jgi:hypothetical protein